MSGYKLWIFFPELPRELREHRIRTESSSLRSALNAAMETLMKRTGNILGHRPTRIFIEIENVTAHAEIINDYNLKS